MQAFLSRYLPPSIVKKLPIIIAVFLLAIAAVIFIIDAPRREALAEILAASGRIQYGLNNIPVTTGGIEAGLNDFLDASLGGHQRIDVDLDFQRVLGNVHTTDFTTAWQEREAFIDGLYNNIARLFSQTDDLSVRIRK